MKGILKLDAYEEEIRPQRNRYNLRSIATQDRNTDNREISQDSNVTQNSETFVANASTDRSSTEIFNGKNCMENSSQNCTQTCNTSEGDLNQMIDLIIY